MEFSDLIKSRREALKLSQATVAKMAGGGMKQQDVKRIESGETKNSKYMNVLRQVLEISDDEFRAFWSKKSEDTQEKLLVKKLTAGVTFVPVRGETAAGQWLEYEYFEEGRFDPVPALPTSHGRLKQFAYKVKGRSMENEGILDGSYVVCVQYDLARNGAQVGDVVVAERTRGGLTERSCKAIGMDDQGNLILQARSEELVFRDPIPLAGFEEDTTVTLVGLVVGVYRPMSQ